MIDFINKNKITILLVIGIIVIACIMGDGNYTYNLHTSEVQKLKDSISSINDSLAIRRSQLKESEMLSEQIDKNIKTYYYEYQRERARTKQLQQHINTISSLKFNRKYLDSLKSSIEYPR